MDNSTYEDPPSKQTTVVAPLIDVHTHTVVFLHGREDFGSDLASSFFDSESSDKLSLAQKFPSIKWVFPTAKVRYSAQRDFEFSNSSFAEALKGEEIISQWFDIWDVKTPEEREDLMIPGLQESIHQIVNIIQEEAQNIPMEHIILGGISQGCATAILTFLSSAMMLQLGGFIGLCGWLPFERKIENMPGDSSKVITETRDHVRSILHMDGTAYTKSENTSTEKTENVTDTNISDLEKRMVGMSFHAGGNTPVFLAHSKDDEMVPFCNGMRMQRVLSELGLNVIWKEYPDGGHWIHPEHGVDDMITFFEMLGIESKSRETIAS